MLNIRRDSVKVTYLLLKKILKASPTKDQLSIFLKIFLQAGKNDYYLFAFDPGLYGHDFWSALFIILDIKFIAAKPTRISVGKTGKSQTTWQPDNLTT